MNLEILHMPTWKSKILNATAWLIGIRGENCWVITISNNFPHEIENER